jgi:hypothetical protein
MAQRGLTQSRKAEAPSEQAQLVPAKIILRSFP